MMVTTKEQRQAIHRLFMRNRDGSNTYREFRRRVVPCFGNYLGITWCRMFIGIERDGHTHS